MMTDTLDRALRMLTESGHTLSPEQEARLLEHCALVRKWNSYVSLVSAGDLERLEEIHLSDALSMAPLLAETAAMGATLVDLGTGGGYPVIPIMIALPELSTILVERATKKVGVLRNMLTALGLKNAQIVHGTFPDALALPERVVITARAIEKPQIVNEALAEALPLGGVFWCPSGDTASFCGPQFTVTPWHDAWTDAGLRRGTLHRIERVA